MLKQSFLTVISILSISTVAQAAVIGINFATIEQTESTAAYASSVLGLTVSTWQYDGGPNGNDWSGANTSFSADGQSINIRHDAANTWRNVTQAESSPLHGYLDDGFGTSEQRYIHLTGLAAWLGAVGDSAYRFTVLRSSDNASGWDSISVVTGQVTGESGWMTAGAPTGGTVSTSSIPAFDTGGAAGPATYETPVFVSDANGISLYFGTADGTGANPRGTIAGIIIESIPEPGSALLGLLGCALLLRRRR